MKKFSMRFVRTIFLTLSMLFCISCIPNRYNNIYAYGYWDDDLDMDEHKPYSEYNFDTMYDPITISSSSSKYTYPEVTLDYETFNAHFITVKDSADYIIGLSEDYTYGEGRIEIIKDGYTYNEYEEEFDIRFDKYEKNIYLEKGDYIIFIYSNEELIGLDYELYIKPETRIVKKTKKVKIYSCGTQKLNPKLGKGKWTTSNKNIVSLKTKNTNNSSVCTIWAKKTGTATVTYKNDNGSVIKYKITVKNISKTPLAGVTFVLNSAGGAEPSITIVNNSNKKIKYIYFDVCFYNAVNDKIKNDIGGNTTVKLEAIGPQPAWTAYKYSWGAVFYNYSADRIKIKTMTIKYFDGSKKTYKY